MDKGIIQLNIVQFSMIYLLLLAVLFIMKKAKINQSKLLFTASLK
ncbi:MAG: amino acid ABC transporter permease, partial [Erysipelothrix sp.]|nr:amino acid ABC transporter permease [Erysipelothrix sp.]